MSEPKLNTAFTFDVTLFKNGAIVASPTLAAGDFKITQAGGALANVATLPTVAPAAGGNVAILLSATEMNTTRVVVKCIDQTSPKEWDDVTVSFQTLTNTVADVKTDTAAVKVATDQMVFTKVNELDTNVKSTNGVTITGDGSATPFNV